MTPYNTNYVIKSIGLINLGATCYFNSMLQCLLSCSSIIEVIDDLKDKKRVIENKTAISLLNLFNNPNDSLGVPIWKEIIAKSQSQDNRVRMGNGQEDAHEGLMMFLDIIEMIPEVRQLFEHRHRIDIYCKKCNNKVSNTIETNTVFEIQPEDIIKDTNKLNEFLKKQNVDLDNEYKCPGGCGTKGNNFKVTTLTMIPEILPVVIKQYQRKTLTSFPLSLEFTDKNNKKLI